MVASPKKMKKPPLSVIAVIITLAPIAGSRPSLTNVMGINTPIKAANKRLSVMAAVITTPSDQLPYSKYATTPITPPHTRPLIKPTASSLRIKREVLPLNTEVWVPFDRLWRSGNRIGPVDEGGKLGPVDGRLWEISETGHEGEALGPENGPFKGEGKHVPAHQRKSHTTFVKDVSCAQCNEAILERCESCSVRMHCMGCRKTLCASCAFNRPIPRKRAKTRHFANLAFGTGPLGDRKSVV